MGVKLQNISLPNDQEISGRTLGQEEIDAVQQALASGTLTSTKGTFTKSLEAEFARLLNLQHALACSSGTAALHTAIAAVDPEPGDEIVTTSITDMGALTPILYQGAIPVFADVDPDSCNVTASSIERVLSPRTRAIIVTHLFGNPCDMSQILPLAAARGIPVIEDAAQAFLASCNGQLVGTLGDIGCFSLQQGKHITTGEGGLVTTRDPELGRRMFLFINKAWGYGDANPDHYFLALNYRMCELQGAVALAQLAKLSDAVAARREMAAQLEARLGNVPGVRLPSVAPGCRHAYWRFILLVDDAVIPGGPEALAQQLKARGIGCAPRYIQKPAFRCAIFAQQKTFGTSRFPFTLARPEAIDYSAERFRGTFAALNRVLVLPWNEKFHQQHVEYIADAVCEAAAELSRNGRDAGA